MRRKISVRARVRLRRLIGRSRGRASLPARRDNVTSREVSWQGEGENEGRQRTDGCGGAGWPRIVK